MSLMCNKKAISVQNKCTKPCTFAAEILRMCLSDISSQRLWMLLFASSKCSSLWSSSSGMASHLFSKKIVSSGSKQNISSLESLTCWIIRQSYKKIKCEIVKKNQKVKKDNGKHNFSILLVVRKLFSFTVILIDRKFTIISTNWKHKKRFLSVQLCLTSNYITSFWTAKIYSYFLNFFKMKLYLHYRFLETRDVDKTCDRYVA